jgi:sodium/bile acid cotransporter 7
MDVQKAKDFILKNFLILGLLTVITFGLVCPTPGTKLNNMTIGNLTLTDYAIDCIFILSGLCLENISDAMQPKAMSLGMVLVLFVTPLLAIPIMHLKDLDPSLNISFLQGMSLFCVVPTTLSSGVTMITQAKGNVSLAILLTTATNIVGVFTMSATAPIIFSLHTIKISTFQMLRELLFLTLFPLCVGMALRRFVAPLREFATKNKKQLGLTQNSCILFVVLLNISKAEPDLAVASPKDLGVCLTLAASVHLIYRLMGYLAANAAELPPKDWVTIVLMCSQKSLPVCVSVMAALPAALRANSGLFIIPCIMAHAAQLIIDSLLAVRWEVQADGRFKTASSARESSEPLLLC